MTESQRPPSAPPAGPGGRTAVLLLALTVALAVGVGGLLLARDAEGPALAPEPVRTADWGLAPTRRAVEATELRAAALDRARVLLLALAAAAGGVSLATALALEAGVGTAERFPLAVRSALGASPRRVAARLLRRRVRPLVRVGLGAGGAAGAALAVGLALAWPGTRSWAAPPAWAFVLAVGAVGAAVGVALAPLRYGMGSLSRYLAPGGAGSDPWEGGARRLFAVLQMTVALGVVAAVGGALRAGGTAEGEDAGGGAPSGSGAEVAEAVLVPLALEPTLAAESREARWRDVLERARRAGTFSSESIATPGAWSGLGRVDLVVAECGMCVRGGLLVPILGEDARQHVVSPGFFEHAGIDVVDGRGFGSGDVRGAAPVAIVSRSFALRNFEDGDPLGRRVRLGGGAGAWHTVVGVVEEPRGAGLGRSAGREPAVYLSALQHPPDRVDLAVTPADAGTDVLAALAPPEALVAGPPSDLTALRRRARAPLAWIAGVGGGSGLVALLAALVGAWAVAWVEVRARRRDLGVRAALGAGRRDLVGWVLGRTARAGLLAGVLAVPLAVGVSGLLREAGGALPLLDLPAFAAAWALLLAAALAGSGSPARAAAAAEPARVLTTE